ncbi:MAG: nicotinate-nucleotide adenylyltransferase [Xanthomonadales bacterium]|nr:nicotinate-nucleotide adenylyltransferase [Xanthomonadales bacterium]
MVQRGSRGIGIFGGTFDPVHFGHLRAALEASEYLGLDDFRLLPAGRPPHRTSPVASAEQRLAMLQTAVRRYPVFRVDDREVRRPGESYMVDTLRAIRGEAGDMPLLLMVGQDAANELDRWHEWRRLFDLAHLVIMRRPGAAQDCSSTLAQEMLPRFAASAAELMGLPAGRIWTIEVTQLAISSTDIRKRLASGRSASFLLPESVIDYIRAHGLYNG